MNVGDCFINKFGETYIITKDEGWDKITIEFRNGYKKTVRREHIKNNSIKSPYAKTVYSVGCIGEGKYNKKDHPKIYSKWNSMLRRCYSDCYNNKNSKNASYKECYVCKLWHNYQNFAKWYEEKCYNINGETMCLDKDILVKDNKVYSPETCILVPERINNLFIKEKSTRGKYPIGVTYHRNKYVATCFVDGKNHIIGNNYSSPFQAFMAYKQFKECLIKKVAESYKELIPIELYNAMCNYQVEIND